MFSQQPYNPMRFLFFFFKVNIPFYRFGNWGKKLSNLPKVTQLTISDMGINRYSLAQVLAPNHYDYKASKSTFLFNIKSQLK